MELLEPCSVSQVPLLLPEGLGTWEGASPGRRAGHQGPSAPCSLVCGWRPYLPWDTNGLGICPGPQGTVWRNKHLPCMLTGLWCPKRLEPPPLRECPVWTSPCSPPGPTLLPVSQAPPGSRLQDNSLGQLGQRAKCVATPIRPQKGPLVPGTGGGGESECVLECPTVSRSSGRSNSPTRPHAPWCLVLPEGPRSQEGTLTLAILA